MPLCGMKPASLIDPRESRHLYYSFARNGFFRSVRLVVFHTRRPQVGFRACTALKNIYEIKLKALDEYEQH
jgi:hypothetical protein